MQAVEFGIAWPFLNKTCGIDSSCYFSSLFKSFINVPPQAVPPKLIMSHTAVILYLFNLGII